MIKSKKVDDNTTLYLHAKTNEPIATATAKRDLWNRNKKRYSIQWHPVTKELYPATKSLTYHHVGEAESAGEAANMVEGRYTSMTNGSDTPDPLQTSKTDGLVSKNISTTPEYEDVRKFHHFFVHDPSNGNVVASLHIGEHMLKHTHEANVFRDNSHAFIEYLGDKPSDAQRQILEKKHPKKDPLSLLNRVKTWMETKDKEPSFIGSHGENGIRIYTTKLAPEKAASQFAAHLKSKMPEGSEFEQISPTIYRHIRPASHSVSESHELVDASTPGRVVHSTIKIPDTTSYRAHAINEVID